MAAGDDDYQHEDEEEGDAVKTTRMPYAPDRGRIIIVDFQLGGALVWPEMRKSSRPCIVVQNNKIRRGGLVTVVPLSTTAPIREQPYHHRMDHRSFREMPLEWGDQGLPRWAKCDYVATVSLDRCVDPYAKRPYDKRRYVKVKAIKADMDAVDRCVLWALGINVAPAAPAAPAGDRTIQ